MSKVQFLCIGVIAGPAGLITPGADGVAAVDVDVADWLDGRIDAGALPGVERLTERASPADPVGEPAGIGKEDKVVPIAGVAGVDTGTGDEATGDDVDLGSDAGPKSEPDPEPEPTKPPTKRRRGKAAAKDQEPVQ